MIAHPHLVRCDCGASAELDGSEDELAARYAARFLTTHQHCRGRVQVIHSTVLAAAETLAAAAASHILEAG